VEESDRTVTSHDGVRVCVLCVLSGLRTSLLRNVSAAARAVLRVLRVRMGFLT